MLDRTALAGIVTVPDYSAFPDDPLHSEVMFSMIDYETDFYSWTQEQATLLQAGRLTEQLAIDH